MFLAYAPWHSVKTDFLNVFWLMLKKCKKLHFWLMPHSVKTSLNVFQSFGFHSKYKLKASSGVIYRAIQELFKIQFKCSLSSHL